MRNLLVLFVLIGCGDDSVGVDATIADTGADGDASNADTGTDGGIDAADAKAEVEFFLRFAHLIPDLGNILYFCVSADRIPLGTYPPAGATFRTLTDWIPFTVDGAAQVVVVGSTEPDCSVPLFATSLGELRDGRATAAGFGLFDTSASVCGENYTAPCGDAVGIRARHWWDDTTRFDTQIRFVNLGANSFNMKVCVDPDGDGPRPAEELSPTNSSMTVASAPIPVGAMETADWFVIRANPLLDDCHEAPDVLARIVLPTPESTLGLSPRVARTIEDGNGILFVGAGIVRLPPNGETDSFAFVPWLDR